MCCKWLRQTLGEISQTGGWGGGEGGEATPISAPHDENNWDRVGFGHIYGFNLWPIDIIYGVQAIKYIGFLTMKKLFMKNINSRHYVCSHCVNISVTRISLDWELRVNPTTNPIIAANLSGFLIQILDDPCLGIGWGPYTFIWLMHGLFWAQFTSMNKQS